MVNEWFNRVDYNEDYLVATEEEHRLDQLLGERCHVTLNIRYTLLEKYNKVNEVI